MKEWIITDDFINELTKKFASAQGRLHELIRCKDCKYNNGGRCSWHGGAGYKWIVDDDDYCSVGEGREECRGG